MTPYPCHPTGTLIWLATRRRPDVAAKILRHMIADCELMYPWPALVESWRRDVEKLEAKHEQ